MEMGWRGGRRRSGPWPGSGPFSYLPPWRRPGRLFGYGAGLGYRPWGGVNDPYVCQRFPWLPRWWWAAPSPEAELKRLESYVGRPSSGDETVRQDVEARIGELKKMIEEGARASTSPPYAPTPFWGPPQYAPTPEQEKDMLERQVEIVEGHLEAVRKRLQELGE